MSRRSKRRDYKSPRSFTLPRTMQKSRRQPTLLRKRNYVPHQFAAVPLQISPKRRSRLDPSVSASPLSTVRRPLIRTVLSDTTRPVPRHLRPLHSPATFSRTLSWWSPPDVLAPVGESPRDVRLTNDLHRATMCARRSIRREVLHALRQLNGRGGRGKPKSKTRC